MFKRRLLGLIVRGSEDLTGLRGRGCEKCCSVQVAWILRSVAGVKGQFF